MDACKDCGALMISLFGPQLYCKNECDLKTTEPTILTAEDKQGIINMSLHVPNPTFASGRRFWLRANEDLANATLRAAASAIGLGVSTSPNWGASTVKVREIKIIGRFDYSRKGFIKKLPGEPLRIAWS